MNKKVKFTTRVIFSAGLAIGCLTTFWYTFIALKEQPLAQDEILASYAYRTPADIGMSLREIGEGLFEFSYRSYDGALVNGRISYPPVKQEKYPVLVGMAAMGRGYQRWWVDSFKGRPTVTRVNEITERASQKGYVVVAIDARFHGTRKDPNRTLGSIMNNLHFFGDKRDYEAMIRETVLDYRVLMDWIAQQPDLDGNHLTLAGYSMGAQVALLASALDPRVDRVIAMVPPHIDDKTAVVAPKNLAGLIKKTGVLLITADDDEYASKEDNLRLYDAIASENKKHQAFAGGHILPGDYIDAVGGWL
ncbi:Alpha/beta hydrolase family protein [Microbulbifer aggregans]|uniref:Alpha/beta hydrolase family protein n=1 Tax=Microbulbifer aggregans TaxID=1769779 RepID=A0A1C9W6G8_9GAMM|nr:alpha/beta fold hydrolase [Microbulbifer aggregans]AOS96741.1 Alpha/beta hydrolase family protein [Microbulbifer aggregans]